MHQGDLIYRVEQLEKILYNRTGGRRLENSSIGAGGLEIIEEGNLTIDGGELVMLAPNGVIVARWGDVVFGGASRGWELNYADGSRGFILGGSEGNQAIAMYDQSGNYVFTTDAISKNGLGRPYLNYPLVPSLGTDNVNVGPFWPSTTSTSYVEMFHLFTPIQHPKVVFGLGTAANGGATDWRFMINDEVIASGSGSSAATTYEIPGWGESITPLSRHNLKVEAKNTTGSRSWVQWDACYGKES
jgi:hypothetical protein